MSRQVIVAVETYRHKSIGSLIRCASAFGASELIIVGSPKYSTHGAHGAQKYMDIIHFYYWSDCYAYVKQKSCDTVGILSKRKQLESKNATIEDINGFQITNQSVCLIVGERDILSDDQIRFCDVFTYVKIENEDNEELLSYESKVAICLQTLAIKFEFEPISFENEKHELGKLEYSKTSKLNKLGKKIAKEKSNIDETNEHCEGVSLLFDQH